ncbi:SRPBCC family protein [Peristeroidobacter soli]|uniref:SRPBCC family protein n=1 Tax=Peristeroidobacter soli TaxID=2497877 RepID=UPI00101BC337|nr:SRPBCC family protein [Peristeroidobacter soli]
MAKAELNAPGETASVPSVRFTRLLPGPIERVWSYLTDPKKLPAWYGEVALLEPRQGGKVRLVDGHIRGIVTQWQPPHKLVHTWNVFDADDAEDAVSAYPESYPTFELESRGTEVLLTFEHFPVLERFIPQNAMGWHTLLDMLTDAVNDRPVQERAAYMAKNAAIYGIDLKNLTR